MRVSCVVHPQPAAAAMLAVSAAWLATRAEYELELVVSEEDQLGPIVRGLRRRSVAVERRSPRSMHVAGRKVALVASPDPLALRVEAHGQSLAIQRPERELEAGSPAELLALGRLVEALERGPQLRWALITFTRGQGEVDAAGGSLALADAALPARTVREFGREFPALVGRVSLIGARGPQLGCAITFAALLGAGADVGGLTAQLADGSHTPGRWPALAIETGVDSRDALGQSTVLVERHIHTAGPLVRIAAYFDPLTLLASDLLARIQRSSSGPDLGGERS